MLKRIVKYLCMAMLITAGLMSIIATGGSSSDSSSSSSSSGSGAGK